MFQNNGSSRVPHPHLQISQHTCVTTHTHLYIVHFTIHKHSHTSHFPQPCASHHSYLTHIARYREHTSLHTLTYIHISTFTAHTRHYLDTRVAQHTHHTPTSTQVLHSVLLCMTRVHTSLCTHSLSHHSTRRFVTVCTTRTHTMYVIVSAHSTHASLHTQAAFTGSPLQPCISVQETKFL